MHHNKSHPSQMPRPEDTQKQAPLSGRNEERMKINNDKCESSENQQCYGKELALLTAVGSKKVHATFKFDPTCSTSSGGQVIIDGPLTPNSQVPETSSHDAASYQVNISIPKPISLPRGSSVHGYTSNNATSSASAITSRQDLLPFSEAVMRGGISGNTNAALSDLISQVHRVVSRSRVSSNLGIQAQPSFTWLLQRLSPTLVSTPMSSPTIFGYRCSQLGHTPSSLEELARPSDEINLPRQQYMRSVLHMHMLDSGDLQGSISFRISNGRSRRQDILILGDSSFMDMSDFRDRHEGMRLDVDNMSYEELLDLEDRIGDVNTGLSEEMINKFLTTKRYFLFTEENTLNESCSICQEDYTEDDELGTLSCEHEFHTACIKNWLRRKNICPICKSTGLNMSKPNIPTY